MGENTGDITGGCLCGSVRYTATGASKDVCECHCSQCRKQTGHRYATIRGNTDSIKIEGGDQITWYRASPLAERGFCSKCGSHLFYKPDGGDHWAILAGSVDDTSSLRMTRHIFVADKPAYYGIDDDLPKFSDYDTPVK